LIGTARWDEMAVVGRVARSHGLSGEVIVNPETDFPETRFAPGGVVYRERTGSPEALRIVSSRLHRGRPIVAFDGIRSVDEAGQLAGVELRVPESWLEPLPAGSYYLHELAGCRVDDASGRTVGTVERVEGDGGASRLVVRTDGGEVLVPLAGDICSTIDVARQLIVIDPPEGLIALNAPGRGSQRESWRPDVRHRTPSAARRWRRRVPAPGKTRG
jgi:16S rRNA processing protein RimM